MAIKKRTVAKKAAPKKGVTLHKTDTSKAQELVTKELRKSGKAKYPAVGTGFMPMDMPVYIEVERAMGPFHHKTAGDSKGLYGHVITINPFTKRGMGHIKIKLYRDPNSLKISVGGEDVFKWTEDPNDMPTKFAEFAERDGKIGGAWAENVELEPGDEVLEGDVEGIPVVKRQRRKRASAKVRQPTPVKKVAADEVDEEGEIEWE
jgi:hypothetical protein